MPHLALLGDSIFDNGAYVSGGPDVVALLREELGGEVEATLLAVDGAVVAGVARQLERLPRGITHLAVSVGGNDALGSSFLLEQSVRSVGEGVAVLAEVQRRFRAEHQRMLEQVKALGLPTIVATIYDANFDPPQKEVVSTALSVFNDAITRNAVSLGMDVLDLRVTCSEPADYANPIEPSVQGGGKIAGALAQWLRSAAGPGGPSRVFV
jgi:hypothetical protein